MIYKPSQGRFKDTSIVWHDGRFYLFSMHTPSGEEDFRNVWMATSTDGVHWEDIGTVIEGAPFNIWAMSVHKVGDRFIMNHGTIGNAPQRIGFIAQNGRGIFKDINIWSMTL